MEKIIVYEGKPYTIEIKWGGNTYLVRAVGVGGYHILPMETLDDIEKIKPYIIKAIEDNKTDLDQIKSWDGIISL